MIPKIEVNLSGYYRFLSGRHLHAVPAVRHERHQLARPPPGRQPFLEPRGNRRLDSESYLDLRIEKIFNISDFGKLSVFADVQNVFNASTVDAVNARYPNISVAGYDDPIAFEGPTERRAAAAIPPRSALELLDS